MVTVNLFISHLILNPLKLILSSMLQASDCNLRSPSVIQHIRQGQLNFSLKSSSLEALIIYVYKDNVWIYENGVKVVLRPKK